MRKRGDIVSYTDSELKSMQRRGLSRTDWKRVDAMTEAELEASIAADPDDIHDELDWFKQSGEGYQTRMNNVLRAFFESRQHRGASKSILPKRKRMKHAN